ncbi:uncharacterized protein ARMOST_19041 [Armillaria ostoyae]|uniref:Chromo domain-containing protein n=1 Tax=Armillaria ostoyae TaxID=47428 RepID=A0A284S3F2_ARMOS|nr:uncharacterized protein ARMOST_19041 [Armillaria ostoyae]
MTQIHKETEAALEEAAGRMKRAYDKHKHDANEYHIGELKKLDDKRVGPFKILEKTGASAYKLKLPPHWKIHLCFNKKLLTPYTPPPPVFPNQEQPPPSPPDLIDGEEEWEIEEILNSKTRKVHRKRGQPLTTVVNYFIKWKGWTREHNSWVAESEMGNAEEAIAEYKEKTGCNERVNIVKIATPSSRALTMILDHDYQDNSDVFYLAQRRDRTQKWVKNPNKTLWKEFLDKYWASQADAQYDSPPEEP